MNYVSNKFSLTNSEANDLLGRAELFVNDLPLPLKENRN